jgi:hypothetical protein
MTDDLSKLLVNDAKAKASDAEMGADIIMKDA